MIAPSGGGRPRAGVLAISSRRQRIPHRCGVAPYRTRHHLDVRTGTVHPLPSEAFSFEDAALAASTREKYRNGWIDFCAGVEVHDLAPFDAQPGDVRRWLEQLRRDNLAVSTVYGRLAAFAWHFERVGRPSPVDRSIRRAVTGYARRRGTGTRQARPLMLDDLRRIVAGIPTGRLVAQPVWSGAHGSTSRTTLRRGD